MTETGETQSSKPGDPEREQTSSGGRARTTVGWLLASLLIVAGFAGGFALSGATSTPPNSDPAGRPMDSAHAPSAKGSESVREGALAEVVHRFPLSPDDVKETMESAALAVTDDGRVHVAWASRVNRDEWQAFLTTSTDGGASFSSPRVVAKSQVHRAVSKSQGKTVTREMRMLPRLAAVGNDLLLAWVEAVEDNQRLVYYSARSTDGGETFSRPQAISSVEAGRPSFTGFTASADGRLAASWLDNRQTMQLPAVWLQNGSVDEAGSEHVLDISQDGKGVCPCCPTSVVFSDDGTLYLAFRHQQDGFRDMWLSRLAPGEDAFAPPQPIVEQRWKFDGCPHDGPALAVVNDDVFIAWMDASSGQPRVYYTLGEWNQPTFAVQAIAPEAAGSQGHPAVALDHENRLHVAWDEGSGDAASHDHDSPIGEATREIRYLWMDRNGGALGKPAVVAPLADGFQSRPAVAIGPAGNVFVAWVELTPSGKSIAVARLGVEE